MDVAEAKADAQKQRFPFAFVTKNDRACGEQKGFPFGTLRKATDDKGFPLGGAVAEGGR